MKQIGVVANHKTINFGTMLQAYATQCALEKLGFKVETININGIAKDIRSRKISFFLKELTKKELLDSKLPTVKKALQRKMNRTFAAQLRQREEVFRRFRENKFPMSEICTNRDALTKLAKKYDTVLVGSDQIWLPSNIAADVFTLNFVPDEVNKVAYASSFGVSKLPPGQHDIANHFLNRINHVSVREISGQQLVRDIAKRDVPVVCDPTILFDKEQWCAMIPDKKLQQEPYIFSYFLGNNPEQRRFVSQIRERTGLKVIAPLHLDDYIESDNSFPDYTTFDMGPEEFLNYIRHAQYVFTDSFHGTVLSVLHSKNVFTFNRFKPGAAQSTNTRIDSLYSILGIPERHITTDVSIDAILQMSPNFSEALGRIDSFRKDSWKYLKNALGVN